MYQTVEAGTGKRARIDGYTIGGKTGTAEKQPRGNEKYVISFIGFAPVEKPQIVLFVTVDEPREADQSHSGAASLLAHDIFQEVLPYMNIFQSNTAVDDGTPVVDEAATPVESGEETPVESGEETENTTEQGENEDSSTQEEESTEE